MPMLPPPVHGELLNWAKIARFFGFDSADSLPWPWTRLNGSAKNSATHISEKMKKKGK